MIRRNPHQEPAVWVDTEGDLGLQTLDEPHPPRPADPYRKRILLFVAVLALTLPAIVVAMVLVTEPRQPNGLQLKAEEIGVTPAVLAAGRHVFRTNCAMCHGQDGGGVSNLGKSLRNSGFVGLSEDEDLFDLIVAGRPADHPENTTGVAMPARGLGRLPDEQIRNVVAYLRSLQNVEGPETDEASLAATEDAPAVDAEAMLRAATAGIGRDQYRASCSACHGQRGEGVESAGLPLVGGEFVPNATDRELASLIRSGRPIWHADNQTGLDMPPKGGNPTLTDAQIEDIVKYIRELNAASGSR